MARKKKKPLAHVILQIEEKQAHEWGYQNRWIKMDIYDLYMQGLSKQTEKKTFKDEELIEAVRKYINLPPDFLTGYRVVRATKVTDYVLVTKE